MIDTIIPQKEKRTLRYDFTAIEIHDLALALANKTKELQVIEEEKKSVTSQYAAKINETKATCNKLSNHVADGYEFRDIDCTVEYHKPIQGFKTLTRSDNNKTIEEKMNDWEWNLFNQPDINGNDWIEEEKEKLGGRKKK